MSVAVISRLDVDGAAGRIEWLADGLADRESSRSLLYIGLATYADDSDVSELNTALARIVRPWTQLSVTLIGSGMFPGNPSDLCLPPVPICASNSCQTLHRRTTVLWHARITCDGNDKSILDLVRSQGHSGKGVAAQILLREHGPPLEMVDRAKAESRTSQRSRHRRTRSSEDSSCRCCRHVCSQTIEMA
jgi:hypothetical protein